MHFLRVNVMFYDVVNMIHDVITTHNPFLYTAKFMFLVLEIIKLNKSDVERYIEYVHSVVVYQKHLIINFPNLVRYFLYMATLYTYSLFKPILKRYTPMAMPNTYYTLVSFAEQHLKYQWEPDAPATNHFLCSPITCLLYSISLSLSLCLSLSHF